MVSLITACIVICSVFLGIVFCAKWLVQKNYRKNLESRLGINPKQDALINMLIELEINDDQKAAGEYIAEYMKIGITEILATEKIQDEQLNDKIDERIGLYLHKI